MIPSLLQVEQMRDELIKLHPTDDSDQLSNASDRSDSSDSFDPKHHASSYHDNPDTGKKRFQVGAPKQSHKLCWVCLHRARQKLSSTQFALRCRD